MAPETAAPGNIDISFIVAARNVAAFIEGAIGSALAQKDCSVEVVVVDDASTDDTAALVQRMVASDGRVRLFRRSARGGAGAARNQALAHVVGDWVAILDGDDLMAPGRGCALLDVAAATSADIVADGVARFGDGAAAPSAVPDFSAKSAPYCFTVDPASYLRSNRPLIAAQNLGYLKPMFRRAFLVERRIAYDERLRIAEDFRFCLDCLLAGARFCVMSETLYGYRVRAGSLSWRLRVPDIDAMIEAHAGLDVRSHAARMPDLAAASRQYERSLRRARAIAAIAEAAQSGSWSRAAVLAATRPDTWGFLVRVAAGRAFRPWVGRVRTPAGQHA